MKNAPNPGSFWATNGQNLALSSRKWHKKNLIGENGGEKKKNPSANPVIYRHLAIMVYSEKSLNTIALMKCEDHHTKKLI